MRKGILVLSVVAAMVAASGCIGVSASKQVSDTPRWQVAVVDGDIYLVDVKRKTAKKVQIEGVAVAEAASDDQATTLSADAP